jgi:arginyl-tRNA synthetase
MKSISDWVSFHVRQAVAVAFKGYTIPPKLQKIAYDEKFRWECHYKLTGFIAIHRLLLKGGWKGPAESAESPPRVEDVFNEFVLHCHPDFVSQVEVTLNDRHQVCFTLSASTIQDLFERLLLTPTVIQKAPAPKKILVDFSSPNIAKHLHVGHLRSTILGESICRLLEARGHQVLRTNHLGDFGLQFGMLLEEIQSENFNVAELTISDLQDIYVASKKHFDACTEFQRRAYEKVLLLQQGDETINRLWNQVKEISRTAYDDIYERLGATLEEVGESFYQPMIPPVVNELKRAGLLQESDGRQIIRVPGHKLPLTVVKWDGGYTYDTTDLAALRYRLVDLDVDAVYYVVGMEQAEHFQLLFRVAEKMGWAAGKELRHLKFGMILGEDGGKMKSREGQVVVLADLLDQALIQTKEVCQTKSKFKTFSPSQQETIVRGVAYSAVKYADLSVQRMKNYKFSYARMLNLKGNTAPFLMYAYTRLISILRKAKSFVENLQEDSEILRAAGVDPAVWYALGLREYIPQAESLYAPHPSNGDFDAPTKEYSLGRCFALTPAHRLLRAEIYGPISDASRERGQEREPCELELASLLLHFPEVLSRVEQDFQFCYLADYLYAVTDAFHSFHGRVRCLEYDSHRQPVRVFSHRLQLCQATRKVLQEGFWLLGITPLERM